MRRRDLAAAAVLLGFGVIAVSQARGLRLGSVVAPGPGFFPLCLAIAFSLVCVALLVTAARAPAGPAPRAPGGDARGRLKVVGTMAALVAYALLMEPLGFRPATFGLLPGRVTYVIDEGGTVRHVFNSQFQATQHVAEAIAALRTRAR